jgi:hypothetical protein
VYDLLELFGLPGRWTGSGKSPEKAFEEYFSQLGEPDMKARDWTLLRGMLSDYLRQPEVQPNRAVQDQIRRELPGPTRMAIEKFHELNLAGSDVASLSPEGRRLLDAWLRANTPMRDRVFRTSRQALREYQRQGILDPSKTIPRRHVDDRFIGLREPDEKGLYDRIESYIGRYYEAYNQKKETKPLGFIMTVYRRRLTSSLYAVHCSLERRRKVLQEEASADQLLDDDDRQVLETSVAFDPEQLSGKAKQYGEEIAELTSFLHDLEAGIPEDSKVAQLTRDIQQAFFAGHRTVVVFTQYTDTLSWLRDQLKGTYGAQIACYSGNGGSRWNPTLGEWEKLTKKRVKELFRQGDEVRILLGTDAMSEGLNLQTCDRLINYDMPWNFMRVEQRIGRIDRIEGRPLVTITNYFYSGTVEEQVYTGIKEDAEWFEQVVGPAQPVLSQVEAVIEDLAMRKAGDARDQALRQELDEVRQAIADARKRVVKISDLNNPDPPHRGYGAAPVITLDEIERILTTNPLTRPRMHPHPDFAHTYLVEVGGEKHPATFDRQVYDKNPEIRFMTYLEPVFEGLLEEALGPTGAERRVSGAK